MSTPDLDVIQARADEVTRIQNLGGKYALLDASVYRSQSDVPALLAYARDLEARVREAKAVALEEAADELGEGIPVYASNLRARAAELRKA